MMKKTAHMGLFLASALILSYIESLIPFYFGIPGVKLLSNLPGAVDSGQIHHIFDGAGLQKTFEVAAPGGRPVGGHQNQIRIFRQRLERLRKTKIIADLHADAKPSVFTD